MRRKYMAYGFLIGAWLFSCFVLHSQKADIQIAFMADVHLLDVHGTLSDIGYQGILNPKDGKYSLIRSMDAQLHSTRLFNENYFAFRSALDDVVKQGIKIVVLPGDFSDDGQPLNIQGLNMILDEYSEKYEIQFFLTTGNHDPTKPFGNEGGKKDFLARNGKTQPIMSMEGMYASDTLFENPVIISKDIREWGYKDITSELRKHGFFPNDKYLYWETPFSQYGYSQYSLEEAMRASQFTNRKYRFGREAIVLPEVSYLVEPVQDLWLLALDANVYLPKKDDSGYDSAGIGYNQVLEHKQYLIEWTKKVCDEAKRLGKTVVAFSHYPLLDFNKGATVEMKKLFGENAFQAYRIPSKEVGNIFADSGLKVHFGGHMHLNSIDIQKTEKGNELINIQVPSLAAYKPGYTIATLQSNKVLKVKTVILDEVSGFDSFFELYQREYNFLKDNRIKPVWDKNILFSKSYGEFMNFYLKELIRLRFIEEWPRELRQILTELNGEQLYVLFQTDLEFSDHEFENFSQEKMVDSKWIRAKKEAILALDKKGLRLKNFREWNGNDIIFDFYKLRNGGSSALDNIEKERMVEYLALFEKEWKSSENSYRKQFQLFAQIFLKMVSRGVEKVLEFDLKISN